MSKPVIDFKTQNWVNTRLRILEKKEILVEKLQDRTKDHDETQYLRGQIAALKDILNWEKEPETNSR